MGLTSDGTPVLQFMDAKGDPLWAAPQTLPLSTKPDATVKVEGTATKEPAKQGAK
jgi:hypothetical protein